MPTLYEILEIEKNATSEEIKDAYKKLSLKWHPDKNQGSKEAEEKFKEIKNAYEILSNSQKRNEYSDSTGNAQQWLDSNYPKQQFSSQESSKYIILSNGEKQYISPSRSTLTNPVTSLDNIKNKGLEGSLNLVNFVNLKELDLTGNKITRLEVNSCPNLQVIRCDNNPMTNLKFINRSNTKYSVPFAVEIHFSQDELLRDKRELKELNEKLEKQITDLKKTKRRLERERDNRPDIILEEWDNDYSRRPTREQLADEQLARLKAETDVEDKLGTIQQLQEQHQGTLAELTTSRKINNKLKSEKDDLGRKLEELIEAKRVLEDKYSFLSGGKKNVEERLRMRERELQNLNQVLLDTSGRADDLEVMLNDKQNEFTNALQIRQFEVEKKDEHITFLKSKNFSLEQSVSRLSEQLTNLKKQWLKNQETELDELIANLISKLSAEYQDKLDDLLKAQEELSKDSNNFFAKEQLEKTKAKLAKKLEEAEINAVLVKKEKVWNLQLEFLDEPTRIAVMKNLKRDLEKEKAIAEKEKDIRIMKLENDIDKKENNLKQLLDSAKEKLKKKSRNPMKFSLSKEDDYQSCLDKFLEFQKLIVHSENKQEEIRDLLEKQLQLKQNLVKKHLSDEELEEIRQVKEELVRLEIQKSILVSSSNDNKQEYYSQIQIPPKK